MWCVSRLRGPLGGRSALISEHHVFPEEQSVPFPMSLLAVETQDVDNLHFCGNHLSWYTMFNRL